MSSLNQMKFGQIQKVKKDEDLEYRSELSGHDNIGKEMKEERQMWYAKEIIFMN